MNIDELFEEYCDNYCSENPKNKPNNLACINCKAAVFADWLESRLKGADDNKENNLQ